MDNLFCVVYKAATGSKHLMEGFNGCKADNREPAVNIPIPVDEY